MFTFGAYGAEADTEDTATSRLAQLVECWSAKQRSQVPSLAEDCSGATCTFARYLQRIRPLHSSDDHIGMAVPEVSSEAGNWRILLANS